MLPIQTVRYLKLVYLLVAVGTDQLRSVFHNFVESTCFGKNTDAFLALYKENISRMLDRGGIRPYEYNILFPLNKQTDIRLWDITIVSTALLSCCTLKGKCYKLLDLLICEIKGGRHKGYNVHTFLESNKDVIYDLYRQNVITYADFCNLFPSNGVASDVSLWDINLVTNILLHLCQDLNAFKDTLKDIILKELQLHNQNLDAFLSTHQNKIICLKKSGKLSDSEYQQLFPNCGSQSNLSKWKTTVSCCVVLNLCQSYSPDAIVAIKDVRNKVLHYEKPEIDEEKNDSYIQILTKCFNELASFNGDMEKTKESIQDITNKPLLDLETIYSLKQMYRSGQLDNNTIINDLLEEAICTLEASLESGFKDTTETVTHCVRTSEENVKKCVETTAETTQETIKIEMREFEERIMHRIRMEFGNKIEVLEKKLQSLHYHHQISQTPVVHAENEASCDDPSDASAGIRQCRQMRSKT